MDAGYCIDQWILPAAAARRHFMASPVIQCCYCWCYSLRGLHYSAASIVIQSQQDAPRGSSDVELVCRLIRPVIYVFIITTSKVPQDVGRI